MDESELKAMEEAYQKALHGTDRPKLIVAYCEICDQNFILTQSGENHICDHILEALHKHGRT